MSLVTCSDIVRQNAIGVRIIANLTSCGDVIDLTGATTIEYRVLKPDLSVVVWTPMLLGAATDGRVEYKTVTNDLDQLGYYYIEVYLVTPNFDGNSNRFEFKVVDEITP